MIKMEKTEADIRHEENQARFTGIECELRDLKEATAGLVEFLKGAKVGIKWSGRLGRAVIFICKVATFLSAAYGAWKIGLAGIGK